MTAGFWTEELHDSTYILQESFWLLWEEQKAGRQRTNVGDQLESYSKSLNEIMVTSSGGI